MTNLRSFDWKLLFAINWIDKLQHSLDLSLQHGGVGEACGVWNDKVPLVPSRVVPHVVFQEALHKLQLIVPQFVLLYSQTKLTIGIGPQRVNKHWAQTKAGRSDEDVDAFWPSERPDVDGKAGARGHFWVARNLLAHLPGWPTVCAARHGSSLRLGWGCQRWSPAPLTGRWATPPPSACDACERRSSIQSHCVRLSSIGGCFLVA